MYFLILEILQLQMWRQQVTNVSELQDGAPILAGGAAPSLPLKSMRVLKTSKILSGEEMSQSGSTCCQ